MKEHKFVIGKGRHKPYGVNLRPYIGRIKAISGHFRFSGNCYYDLPTEGDTEDYYDISKLLGISWGYHMNNSFRLGWRPKYKDGLKVSGIIDKIEIFAFLHHGNDGRFDGFKKLTEVETMELKAYDIQFRYNEDKVIISFFGKESTLDKHEIPYPFPRFKRAGYFLFPYHGGNLPAPNDMTIYTKANNIGGHDLYVRI